VQAEITIKYTNILDSISKKELIKVKFQFPKYKKNEIEINNPASPKRFVIAVNIPAL
jgi:hypothetical protein